MIAYCYHIGNPGRAIQRKLAPAEEKAPENRAEKTQKTGVDDGVSGVA
jgi:hypothetical protein